MERSRPAGPDAGDRRVASRPAASGSDNPRVTRVQSTADRVAGVRVRGAQPARGVAQARTNTPPRGSNGSVYYFYPRYGYSPYGYRSYYDPWYYGSGPWGWNRFGYGYGSWHTPYLYDPFAYGYLSGPYYWGSSGYSDRDDRDDRDSESMGSLRLRVSPRQAKVYVDGALAGVVDEFDGLGSHLQLPAGRHQVEFRAEGYAILTREVVVEAGKTRTERASLERR